MWNQTETSGKSNIVRILEWNKTNKLQAWKCCKSTSKMHKAQAVVSVAPGRPEREQWLHHSPVGSCLQWTPLAWGGSTLHWTFYGIQSKHWPRPKQSINRWGGNNVNIPCAVQMSTSHEAIQVYTRAKPILDIGIEVGKDIDIWEKHIARFYIDNHFWQGSPNLLWKSCHKYTAVCSLAQLLQI